MLTESIVEVLASISGERERWELTVERLDKEFDSLPGDCLIATGFVAYLGPFVSEYREALMYDWFNEVNLALGKNIFYDYVA